MTAREALEAYAGQENPRGVPFQILEAAAPKAFWALRRVLAVHEPTWLDQWYRETYDAARVVHWRCPECRQQGQGNGYCDTVRAIEEALR